jgi:hypothetical protein
MSEICITPPSQSPGQANKFALSFDRIANTIFQCTDSAIPGLTLPPKEQTTPFVNLFVPGNKIEFDPLTVEFIVDHQYNSWYDIYIWMTGVGFPESFQQYSDVQSNSIRRPGFPATSGVRPPYSDATLLLYTNKNNLQIKMQFFDCFPVSLSSIPLGYDYDANHILKATASFRYSYYKFSRI